MSCRDVMPVFERLALEAGEAILAIYRTDFDVVAKADDSPVTLADRTAEAIILAGLREAFPDVPCVAEEEAAAGLCPADAGNLFFIVDPLDGTKEFVSRNPDFTVNIALVRDGTPEAGVVYAPARDVLYIGFEHEAVRIDRASTAPERRAIRAREATEDFVIVSSRSHRTSETDAFLAQYAEAKIVYAGSSLKFCMIAEGAADLYVRFGRTMQWDTAAGDAVLRSAGGLTNTVDGEAMRYGAHVNRGLPPYANPWFVSAGRLSI